MSRLVFKDGTTVGGALAIGQTLRLGGFIMTACPAAAPTMTPRVIEKQPPCQISIRQTDGSNGARLLKRPLGSHRRLGSRYGL